jgi:SAM-dependent methyltransferase
MTDAPGLAAYPALDAMVALVLSRWPEHRAYIDKSIGRRSRQEMATSELAAAAVMKLAADNAETVADDYRWLCGMLREEELNFARTGAYRYATFEDALKYVYSDEALMARYMHGLLFSHVLWFGFAASLHFFLQRLEARLPKNGRVLEVGPGHGLLLYLALTRLNAAEVHGWDVSQVSLDQTAEAMALLGASAELRIQDMNRVEPGADNFDLVILSHLLEHLEDPVTALKSMRGAIAKGGKLLVNIPTNAPNPDHLILLRHPDEALQMVRDGGFNVVEHAVFTTEGGSLTSALRKHAATIVSIIAEPA